MLCVVCARYVIYMYYICVFIGCGVYVWYVCGVGTGLWSVCE